ncbi:TniQ family protein [Pseudomonas sp. Irchel s3f19]|uniref:TniQ family protein n=1 Tax=Pseudomonas sp. Irchel s3f19 TaxID=2009146 RepID=UPI00117B4EF1|nr:TniQ family protein [Pseudomonas sp. Irchel s3f19]
MFDELSTGLAPRFVLDETLLSWVMRGLVRGKLKKPHLFREAIERGLTRFDCVVPGFFEAWPPPTFEDIEFDRGSELFQILHSVYGTDLSLLQQRFASRESSLLHIHFRHSYCSACLTESMATARFPIWRQAWCSTTTAYCVEHRQPLASSPGAFTPDQRMWTAYRHSTDHPRPDDTLFDRRLAGITIRMQRWIKSIGSALSFRKGIEDLYGLLLSKRTSFAPAGIAAAGFNRRKKPRFNGNLDLDERIVFGLSDSDPYQRMGALLVIGWLCGLISSGEIDYLARYDYCVRRTFPRTPQQLAHLVMQGKSAEEKLLLRERFAMLHAVPSPMMSSFLDGIDESLSTARSRPPSRLRL